MPRRWRFPFIKPWNADETTETTPTGWGALKLPGFRWFLLGNLLSNIGNHMRTTTVSWEVYDRTGNALSLGLIGLVMAGPVLLLALPAGVLADRYSRRLLLLIAITGAMLSGLGLAWASSTDAPLWVTYSLLFVTGVCRALGWPAMAAYVTQLVPPTMFANAATWRSIAFQTAATVGPMTAGILLVYQSPAFIYVVDACSSLVLIAALFIVQPTLQKRSRGVRSWHSLMEGVRFVRNQPVILSTITLDMVAVLFGSATALLPIFAAEVIDVDEDFREVCYGWLRAMPSVGAIAMGLVLAGRSFIHRTGVALYAAVVIFGISTIVFGASTNFYLSLAALFALGAADSVSVVIRSTLLQVLTPDQLRGRVAAVNAMFVNTSNEIGEFESGLMAWWLGAVRAVCLGGFLTLTTVAAVAVKWPQLKNLGPLHEIEPAEHPAAEEGS